MIHKAQKSIIKVYEGYKNEGYYFNTAYLLEDDYVFLPMIRFDEDFCENFEVRKGVPVVEDEGFFIKKDDLEQLKQELEGAPEWFFEDNKIFIQKQLEKLTEQYKDNLAQYNCLECVFTYEKDGEKQIYHEIIPLEVVNEQIIEIQTDIPEKQQKYVELLKNDPVYGSMEMSFAKDTQGNYYIVCKTEDKNILIDEDYLLKRVEMFKSLENGNEYFKAVDLEEEKEIENEIEVVEESNEAEKTEKTEKDEKVEEAEETKEAEKEEVKEEEKDEVEEIGMTELKKRFFEADKNGDIETVRTILASRDFELTNSEIRNGNFSFETKKAIVNEFLEEKIDTIRITGFDIRNDNGFIEVKKIEGKKGEAKNYLWQKIDDYPQIVEQILESSSLTAKHEVPVVSNKKEEIEDDIDIEK